MNLPRTIPFVIVLLATLSVPSCDQIVLESAPENTPADLFEIIWSDIDRNYSYFPLKDIDWDSIYDTYKPLVAQTRNDDELFDTLSDLLDTLEDPHVNLYVSRNRYYSYVFSDTYPEYPKNYSPSIVRETYLENEQAVGPYRFSLIRDRNIGYLRISSFGATESQYRMLDQLMPHLRTTDGLIIDVRDNGGGSNSMSRFVAGHFTGQEVPYAVIRWKNGEGHHEFTAWETETFSPATSEPYLKPVILLTNRGCFSSTEDFVLAMGELSQVTTAGDTTGGGSGNPLLRELPNGWTYRFSHWQMATLEYRFFEGTGIIPDRAAWISEEDSLAGRDTILDLAIGLL